MKAALKRKVEQIEAERVVVAAPKKPAHKCFYAGYMRGCLRCRNEDRWEYYRNNPNPIFGKSGIVRTQA